MNRSLLLICLVAVGCAHQPASCGGTPSEIETQIVAAQHDIDRAWIRHDVPAVSRYFADDFSGITARGRAVTRDDVLRAVATNHETSTAEADEHVRLFGSTAVYTARITDDVTTASGNTLTVATQLTNVWVCRPDGWRIVAAHQSLVSGTQ